MCVRNAGTAIAHLLVKVGEASQDFKPKILSIIPVGSGAFSGSLPVERYDFWTAQIGETFFKLGRDRSEEYLCLRALRSGMKTMIYSLTT